MEKPKNSQYSEIINFDHVNIGFKIRESLWKATMTFLPPPPLSLILETLSLYQNQNEHTYIEYCALFLNEGSKA